MSDESLKSHYDEQRINAAIAELDPKRFADS
jgi:hypothetical protein